jgi:hypothetical protein
VLCRAECKLAGDKFKARWNGLRPRVESGQVISREHAAKIVSGIEDRVSELKALQDQAKEIITNAEQFDLRPTPTFEVLDEVGKEISSEQASWALVGDYSAQLGVMTGEPWVEFRAHLGALNEFLHTWQEKLKNRPRDVVYEYLHSVCVMCLFSLFFELLVCFDRSPPHTTASIVAPLQDMHQYKQLKDVLKYVTGDVFEPEHWRILFTKLRFPPDMTLAKLTLGHFVAHSKQLLENQKDLQALAARAQGTRSFELELGFFCGC